MYLVLYRELHYNLHYTISSAQKAAIQLYLSAHNSTKLIVHSFCIVLRHVRRHFQNKFSTECEVVLPISNLSSP